MQPGHSSGLVAPRVDRLLLSCYFGVLGCSARHRAVGILLSFIKSQPAAVRACIIPPALVARYFCIFSLFSSNTYKSSISSASSLSIINTATIWGCISDTVSVSSRLQFTLKFAKYHFTSVSGDVPDALADKAALKMTSKDCRRINRSVGDEEI